MSDPRRRQSSHLAREICDFPSPAHTEGGTFIICLLAQLVHN